MSVKGPRLLVLGVAVLSMLVAALVLWFSLPTSHGRDGWFGSYQENPRPAFDFSLRDADGNRVRLSDFRGKALLVAFGFTSCPSICPATLANLSAAVQQLPADLRDKVRVVFISVDPARDTPQKLREYAAFFGTGIIPLTGSDGEIATAAKGFGAFFRKAPPAPGAEDNYMVDHSTYVHLIDPDGRFAVLYRFEQLPEARRIAGDLARVLGRQLPDFSGNQTGSSTPES